MIHKITLFLGTLFLAFYLSNCGCGVDYETTARLVDFGVENGRVSDVDDWGRFQFNLLEGTTINLSDTFGIDLVFRDSVLSRKKLTSVGFVSSAMACDESLDYYTLSNPLDSIEVFTIHQLGHSFKENAKMERYFIMNEGLIFGEDSTLNWKNHLPEVINTTTSGYYGFADGLPLTAYLSIPLEIGMELEFDVVFHFANGEIWIRRTDKVTVN